MSCKYFLAALFSTIFFLFPTSIFCQGESTLLFLRIPPSPTLNGMGRVGVALTSKEPLSLHYNPARLGYFSLLEGEPICFLEVKTPNIKL